MARVAYRFRLGTIVTIGLAAGIIFIAFEVMATEMLIGMASAMVPIRMIAAIVVGPRALSAGYSLTLAIVIGLTLHLLLSITYTAILAVIVSWVNAITDHELLSNALGDAFTGVFFGIALYMLNYYVISPMAGWSWFREGGNVVVQFLSHGLFGFVAGWMVAGARSEATGMAR
jgi:hypothetical protein